MPGPLPTDNPRRRNAPTIPTTQLPASGRKGPVPKPPKWLHLGDAATAWWRWAWKTPTAAAWSAGMEPFVARRAMLEDELGHADTVADRLKVLREIREHDDRLGLSPKSQAALRHKVVDDSDADVEPAVAAKTSRWRDLRIVDSAAG